MISNNAAYSDEFVQLLSLMTPNDVQNALCNTFLPSLSYHSSLRSLFCLILSGRLRQLLLYQYGYHFVFFSALEMRKKRLAYFERVSNGFVIQYVM